ncbi:MAG: nitronate monooxygenase [Hydrogenophaga sp.]|uniref:nitronate monooxygenase n=1 Tax=Hydrogenophaga sp. TaxID=1904254 RepID=UPI003D0C69D3
MQTPICERLGCEVPIFAFSHCRDVVVEATRAGGFGVLGAVTFSPEQLERELKWIDDHVDGRPYGVDVLIPSNYDKDAEASEQPVQDMLPAEQRQFMEDLLAREGVPELGPDDAKAAREELSGRGRNSTPAGARKLIDVALRHPQVKLVVSALGTPPRALVDELHARGILVGSLCGKPEHAVDQREAGVDIIVAQGTEAGGHTGQISTLVLVPQVVDVVAPGMAVLAAGGISRGSQIAAAFALGAQGVWMGTVWLGTRESELTPMEKDVLFKARTEDAVQRKYQTGKTVRMIRSKASEAWEKPGAPKHLPPPLQNVLYHSARIRIEKARRADLCSFPAGQVVGTMRDETSVRQVMADLMNEYAATAERLSPLINL